MKVYNCASCGGKHLKVSHVRQCYGGSWRRLGDGYSMTEYRPVDAGELPPLVSKTLQEILGSGWTVDGLVYIAEYPGPRYYVSAKSGLWWLYVWVESDGTPDWKVRNCSVVWQSVQPMKGGHVKISADDVHEVLALPAKEREAWFTKRVAEEAAK